MKSRKSWIVPVFVLALTVALFAQQARAIEDVGDDTYSQLQIFTRALSEIESKYVDDVDMQKLIYGAITGMMESLDPHSAFLDPDYFKEMAVQNAGSFGGLGIEISTKDGYVAVIAPIDDTPAAKAGIRAGDLIVKIEDKSTRGMNLNDAVKLMRGEPGTDITVSIWRKGLKKPLEVTLTREVIKIKAVKHESLEGGYGYVKISTFMSQHVGRELEKALDALEAQPGGLRGLVLDLRNNPGGLLDQAQRVADKFISSGMVVYTQGRIQTQDFKLTATKAGTHPNYPVVVLINNGSASASEIVAGCLQDHQRAVLVGERTFGKASVQTVLRLNDGSALKLTTARYYTPNGRDIQAKGIEPDFFVPGSQWAGMDKEHVEFYKQREADIENHLKNKDEYEEEMPPGEELENPEEDPTKETKSLEERDFQMEYALSLLKTWEVFKKVGQ